MKLVFFYNRNQKLVLKEKEFQEYISLCCIFHFFRVLILLFPDVNPHPHHPNQCLPLLHYLHRHLPPHCLGLVSPYAQQATCRPVHSPESMCCEVRYSINRQTKLLFLVCGIDSRILKKGEHTALGSSFTTSFPLCFSIASVHATMALFRTDIPCSCPTKYDKQFH